MRKTIPSLFLFLILVVSIYPITRVKADVIAFTDGFEDQTFNKWDGNGATIWQIGTTGSGSGGSADPHGGLYDAWADQTHGGVLISDSIDLSGVSSADISMWYRGDDLEDADLIIEFYDGSYDNVFSWVKGVTADDTWHNLDIPITSDYWTSDFRIRVTATLGKNENAWIDDVVVTKVVGGTNYYAYPTQSMSWAGSNSRTWTLSRIFSQGLTFSGFSSRTWDLSRTLSQTITFTADALADLIQFFERTASLALSLVSDSSREWSLKRVLSQGFTMTLNANRAYTAIRGVTQSLTAAISVGRTWDLSRTATQAITFTSNVLADLLSLIQRTASLAVSLVTDSGREWSLKRLFSQGLTLVSNGERMFGAFRTVYQSLTTSMNANRVFSATRGVSQALTTTMNANRYFTAVRTASQTLTTTLNANRVFSAIRDVSQVMTATINANRIWSTTRKVSQTMTTVLNANRVFTAIRTASQSLTTTLSTGRTWDLSRTVIQTITLTSNALADLIEGVIEDFTNFHRYVSATISISLDSTRIWDLSRTVSQTIIFTSNALGDLLVFFSRSVSLTLNFVSNGLGNIVGWLFSLVVTDFDGIPLENATVALTRNNSEVTNWWSTDFNGSIPDQLLSPDDYFLELSKYEYLTSMNPFLLDGNVSLSIPLEGKIEEGAMIINSLTVPISLTALAFTILLFYPRITKKKSEPNSILAIIASIAWFISAVMTLYNDPETWPIALFYGGLSVACVFDVVQGAFFMNEEKDDWDLRG